MAASPRPRTLVLAFLVALLLLGALWAFYAKSAPPLSARMLPESDAIVYLHLAPVRSVAELGSHPVPHDADYQRFIDGSGIDFERDLDDAAFALHRTANPLGPNGPVAYSEVFSGRFDRRRLASYLHSIAGSEEPYAGHTVYSIGSEGRTVRVAILSSRRVAVSNTASPEQIHSILDRARGAEWLPWSGPSVLGAHYHDVPLLSLAWAIGQVGLPFTEGGAIHLFGFRTPWRSDATFIASLRWTGQLRLRVEEIAPGETAAAASAASLAELIKVARFAGRALPQSDQAIRTLLDSAEVGHQGDRAILTASVPTRSFQKLLTPPEAIPAGPSRP